MGALLTVIANFIYQYGVTCAGAPSFHGSYEAPVPSQLRKQDYNEALEAFVNR